MNPAGADHNSEKPLEIPNFFALVLDTELTNGRDSFVLNILTKTATNSVIAHGQRHSDHNSSTIK